MYLSVLVDIIDVLVIDYFIDVLLDIDMRLRIREVYFKNISDVEL